MEEDLQRTQKKAFRQGTVKMIYVVLKQWDSVRNYISGIRTLHLVTGVKLPDLNDYEFKLTFTGLAKQMKVPVKQAQPITP